MSRKASRFEQYHSIFLMPDSDERINLFLNELKDDYDRRVEHDQQLNVNPGDKTIQLSKITKGFQNENFYVADKIGADNAVHSEWKMFLYYFATKLGNKQITEENLVKIKKLGDNTTDPIAQLILMIINVITIRHNNLIVDQATMDANIRNMGVPYNINTDSIVRNKQLLNSITQMTFKSYDNIIHELTGTLIFKNHGIQRPSLFNSTLIPAANVPLQGDDLMLAYAVEASCVLVDAPFPDPFVISSKSFIEQVNKRSNSEKITKDYTEFANIQSNISEYMTAAETAKVASDMADVNELVGILDGLRGLNRSVIDAARAEPNGQLAIEAALRKEVELRTAAAPLADDSVILLNAEIIITKSALDAALARRKALNLVDATSLSIKSFKKSLQKFVTNMGPKTSMFGFNLNKYFKEKLRESMEKTDKLQTTEYSTYLKDERTDEQKLTNVYIKDDAGEVYLLDGDKQVPVGYGTDEYNKLTVNNKCYGTYVNVKGSETTCHEYLSKCLTGTDIKGCVDYFKQTNFWQASTKEVNEMLPIMAEKTLQKFNWSKHIDDKGKSKYYSFDEWLENIMKKGEITKLEKEAISTNDKLRGYLTLLVEKLNGITSYDKVEKSIFSTSKLYEYGIKPHRVQHEYSPSSFDRLGHTLYTSQHSNQYPHGRTLKIGIGMFGGSSYNDDRINNESKQSWNIIKTQYLGLVNELKNNNKTIEANDDRRVNKLIDGLRESEIKLMKIIRLTSQYKELISNFGDSSRETLRYDDMKDMIDRENRTFASVGKKTGSLVDILKSLSSVVEDLRKNKIIK